MQAWLKNGHAVFWIGSIVTVGIATWALWGKPSSEIVGWTQAIGSIWAVLSAVYVSWWQAEKGRVDAQSAEKSERARMDNVIKMNAVDVYHSLSEVFQKILDAGLGSRHPDVRRIESAAERTRTLMAVVRDPDQIGACFILNHVLHRALEDVATRVTGSGMFLPDPPDWNDLFAQTKCISEGDFCCSGLSTD